MTIPNLNPNSLSVARVEVVSTVGEETITFATAFFCAAAERLFLITNYHVVSGCARRTDDARILDSRGRLPGHFSLLMHFVGEGDADGEMRYLEGGLRFPLYKDPENQHDPLWVEHPDFGGKVDVVAIEIPSEYQRLDRRIQPIERSPIDQLAVNDELFIVGYPLHDKDMPNSMPIYKGATIASEPQIFDGEPYFFVDGKTKPGMSGSPVFRKLPSRLQTGEDGQRQFMTGGSEFIGVYSGRDENALDAFQAELGFVWPNQQVLDPILEAALERQAPVFPGR